VNIGNFTSSNTWHSSALSLAGPEVAVNTGVSGDAISITAVNNIGYPNCTASTNYPNGAYVLGPLAGAAPFSHIYRMKGSPSGGVITCSMPNTIVAGAQTADAATTTGGYWQEVGPVAGPCGGNGSACFLPIKGYLVYASSGASGSEFQACSSNADPLYSTTICPTIATGYCSANVAVGDVQACALGATYNLIRIGSKGRLPYEDRTHPLTVMGITLNQNGANSGSCINFDSRIENMIIDAHQIAGEAGLNRCGKENSGFFTVDAHSGVEATLAFVGGRSQNSAVEDCNCVNRNSGNFDQHTV
jgi:hypothetical protein